jgi:hypothetical protein
VPPPPSCFGFGFGFGFGLAVLVGEGSGLGDGDEDGVTLGATTGEYVAAPLGTPPPNHTIAPIPPTTMRPATPPSIRSR